METNDTTVEETAPAAEVTESAPVEEGKEVAATETAAETVETQETTDDYKPKGVQKRIDELTREKYETKRLLDQERAERQRLQEFLAAQQKPQEQTAPPSLEECGWDDEKHRVEVAKWAAKQEIKAIQAEENRQRQQYQQQAWQAEMDKAKAETHGKGIKEFADYEAVVVNNRSLPVTDLMAALITDSPAGHKIAYYLGNNPGEASRIAAMPEYYQAREIGRLETRLNSVQKKITQAPPPVTPVETRGAATKDPENMTTEEWIKWRNRNTSLK